MRARFHFALMFTGSSVECSSPFIRAFYSSMALFMFMFRICFTLFEIYYALQVNRSTWFEFAAAAFGPFGGCLVIVET
jgi:hypothetical protein